VVREWRVDDTVEAPDGTWRLPGCLDGRLPLFCSRLATKPIAEGSVG
jgi:hypothetical protein